MLKRRVQFLVFIACTLKPGPSSVEHKISKLTYYFGQKVPNATDLTCALHSYLNATLLNFE